MNSRCTELLRVSPCGQDTAHRESLASLIIRTAAENSISPGLLLERKFSGGGPNGLRCRSRALGVSIGQSISGIGDSARAFVRRTEELTLLTGLTDCTAQKFAPFSTINGLFRRNLAWSPDFLSESDPRYYPLLWALEPVRVCLKSKRPLQSRCSFCRKTLPMFSGASLVSICPYCRSGLHEFPPRVKVSADELQRSVRRIDYELWVASQVGEFIRSGTCRAEAFNYGETLSYWFAQFGLRDAKQASGHFGASPQAVTKWLNGKATPRLRTTLNICWVLGVSLKEFLSRSPPQCHDGKLRLPEDTDVHPPAQSARRRINRAELHGRLTAILRENMYAMLSFSEICRTKLGRRDIVVRQAYPEMAREISKRFLENRKLVAEIRREQFCAAIRSIATFLHGRGIVPNYKTLGPYLDNPSRLRCDWAIEALRDVRLELGYEDDQEQLSLPL